MSKVNVPPIKCQGIKTKLTPLILQTMIWDSNGTWIEPFMGSGVVGFNVRPKRAIFADSNPHIINFYSEINDGNITPSIVKAFLIGEGEKLSENGRDYYYQVRERFNQYHSPLDFLFLNRACFNGMVRFNQNGEFNVPFNHKPNRFSKAYITKIVNQVKYVFDLFGRNNNSGQDKYSFVCQDFRDTLRFVQAGDFVYCDPPYAGRHTDYFNSWQGQDEKDMIDLLANCDGKFILSTWHSNEYRSNPAIPELQTKYHIITKEHFYHVGARESNRKPMLEALVHNFEPESISELAPEQYQQ